MEDVSQKIDLLDFDRDGLVEELSSQLGLQSFRAKQLFSWIYRVRIRDFSQMTDIAKDVRDQLIERYHISRPELVCVQQSKDGTRKYLFQLEDGERIESVLICQPTRYTLCVSSQVGCAIGCKFCRTAQMGLKRNLRSSEIIGQVLAVKDDLNLLNSQSENTSLIDFGNIVFMGMGEPFHNIDNVIRAVKVLNDTQGLAISGRKITVSTSGLVPAIKQFGESGANANLAISLNASDNETRNIVMPINRRYPIENLLGALREYPLRPGRRITFEYVMLGGVNDREEDLKRVPRLIEGIPAKINLIPYNENAGLGFKSPDRNNINRWQDFLLSRGINATIRWSKGDDINAACGQLATAFKEPKKKDTLPIVSALMFVAMIFFVGCSSTFEKRVFEDRSFDPTVSYNLSRISGEQLAQIDLGEEYTGYARGAGKRDGKGGGSSSSLLRDIVIYLPNRIVDFFDIIRADVGIGLSYGLVARVTEYGQIGLRDFPYPGSLRLGLRGRKLPVWNESRWEGGIGPWFHRSTDRQVTPAEIGVGADLFVVGGYLGMSFDEVADFLLGIFGVDLLEDDL